MTYAVEPTKLILVNETLGNIELFTQSDQIDEDSFQLSLIKLIDRQGNLINEIKSNDVEAKIDQLYEKQTLQLESNEKIVAADIHCSGSCPVNF